MKSVADSFVKQWDRWSNHDHIGDRYNCGQLLMFSFSINRICGGCLI